MHPLWNLLGPALMLAALVLGVAMEIGGQGGPARLFVQFFVVAFGPSLVYALVRDDSSLALFGASLAAALVLALIGLWRRARTRQARDDTR